MKIKDYYKILGLERTASSKDIKDAYKKMALKYHPDKNPTSKVVAQKFAEITEAYNILGDLDKRLHYTMILNRDKKLVDQVKLIDYSIKVNQRYGD